MPQKECLKRLDGRRRPIHRLLEINGGVSEGDTQGTMHFERNEKQPLEADVVIIR